MARGVKGMCPVGARWPWPMISSTWARTASREMPSDSRALAATPWRLVDQPEQDVLGVDVVVIEEPSLLLGEHHDPPRPVGEPLKHLAF